MFCAAALIVGLIENMLPPLLVFAPGVKMGLSNVVTLVAMIILGYFDAFLILFIRCFLLSIFTGNVASLMYSLPAGILSLALQACLYRFVFPKVSIISISFLGALTHNLTQLLIASIVVNVSLFAVVPLTLIASLIAGLFVGIVTYVTVKYLPESVFLSGTQIGE